MERIAPLGRPTTSLAALLVAGLLFASAQPSPAGDQVGTRAIGDTLTVVMRPILSVPEIAVPGGSFTVEALAPQSTTGWTATLTRDGGASYALSIDSANYVSGHERWFLTATVPAGVPAEVYDLEVSASGGVYDAVAHAVSVRLSIENDFYFVQITDPHLPTHLYYYQDGADTDTSEMTDLHAVIDDINIMNPAFVLLTGDVINEGELEDFLNKRYFTRTHRILQRLEVPVYLTAGNHDVGGWDDTPPPDGTARRNWWKFFGWRYLNDPPPDDIYTQNYSFDYGGAHFVGIEAYNNYDRWRRTIYGNDSFTDDQLSWLADDIAAVAPGTPVVAFYHMDFQDQLNLSSLGVDCALWGHIHYTSGSTSSPPYNLSLDNVCDGGRAMRVVRILGGSTIVPSEPIEAGGSGQFLRLEFDPANDGTHSEVMATVMNNQPETFEHGMVKFKVPSESMPYEVDTGEIIQTIVDGSVATCYVQVSMPASTTTHVTISSSTGIADGEAPSLSLLAPAAPNPTRGETSLSFALGRPAHVRAEIVNVAGRSVATLLDGVVPGGPHRVTWDPAGGGHSEAASGVYFYRIESGGEVLSGKLVLLR